MLSVGAADCSVFKQPAASAAVLNRVVGGNASGILGNISANGRVFLVNPNGIMFGADSRVDVGAQVAMTQAISDDDFMSGNYVSASDPASTTIISNAGDRKSTR